MVSIPYPTTICVNTSKTFFVPVANYLAAVTGFTCISRVNQNQINTSKIGFVLGQQAQLIESPTVVFSSLRKPDFGTLPNPSQIFKSNYAKVFGFCDKLFADLVVNPMHESSFSPREPSKQSFRTLSAFALNRGSNTGKFSTGFSELLTVPGFTCRGRSDISQSNIYSKYFWSLISRLCWHFYHDIDVVITLSIFRQSSTSRSLTSQQCYLITANLQVKVNSVALKSYSYLLLILNIFKRSSVQADTRRSKLVDFFGSFLLIDYSSDCLTDVISFQASRFSRCLVNLVMQLGRIPAMIALCYRQDLITGISKTNKCLVNLILKVYRYYQFASYSQGLIHARIILHPDLKANRILEDAHSSHRLCFAIGVGLLREGR